MSIIRTNNLEWNLDESRERERIMEEMGLTEEEKAIVPPGGDPVISAEGPADYCFFCSKKLTIPAVMWSGAHRTLAGDSMEICLHPECVEDFFMRILRDAEEILTGDAQTTTAKLLCWKAEHGL
jgi:hypothetical protein